MLFPEKLFFNTGISTYIWIFSTKKSSERKGKVLLIDARTVHTQLRKNLGEKSYEISDENIKEVVTLCAKNVKSDKVKVFNTTDFAYRQITTQRPLRLKFNITDEAISRLKELKVFINDVPSKKSGERGEVENKAWQELRAAIYEILEGMSGRVFMSRAKFIEMLENEVKKRDVKIGKKTLKTIWQQIGERDEEAEICLDEDGNKEADNDLKDFERVPWGVDVNEYFKKEVQPYASDAWIDEDACDEKDGKVGIVGYEIPFPYYFYEIMSVQTPELIKKDIKKMGTDLLSSLDKLLKI